MQEMKLDFLKRLRLVKRHDPSAENVDLSSNILLQIVFPIVLILAFIVFTKVRDLEIQIYNITRRPGWQQYEAAYLELQKQVLVKTLEELKAQKRKEYGTASLLREKIEVQSGRLVLVDERFENLCVKAYERLNTDRDCNNESDSLFHEVVEDAVAELKRLSSEKGLAFSPITEENKQFIRTETGGFIGEIKTEIVKVQNKTIGEIISYYEAHMGELGDDKLIQLKEDYIRAPDDRKVIYAEGIYKHFIEKIKSGLQSQEIRFLEATWQEFY
jgi:hypothetical protein